MKTFVIGDIHGNYKALLQCLERSGLDYKKDRLMALGDVCDGYPDVRQCLDELLKIKHLDYIIGNHDLWALQWAKGGWREDIWLSQGGYNTIASYGHKGMPREHVDLLQNAHPFIESGNKLFVHGGFNPLRPIKEQELQTLVWDRDLLYDARKKYLADPDFRYDGYDEIFVGHTTTQSFGSAKPLHLCNLWMLDTGAGWSGQLTIMNVDTKEYWQSDPASQLYGRANLI